MAFDDISKVIGAMRDGILVQSADGRILHANQAAADALGGTLEQLYGDTFLSHEITVIHEDGRPFPAERRPCQLTLSSGIAQRDVVMGVFDSGDNLRWLTLSSEPLYGDDGDMAGVLVTIHDSTAQRQARQLLQDDYQSLLESLSDVYYRADISGRVSQLSPSVYQVLGYHSEELLGGQLADLYVEPQGRESFLAALREGGGQVRGYEAALRHKDGSPVWVSTSARYRRDLDGELCCIEGVVRDITGYRHTEQVLRDKQQRLEVAESLSKLGSWEWNLLTDTLSWSDQTYRNLGYTPGTVKPSFELFLSTIHPQDRERVSAIVSDAVAAGSSYRFTYRYLQPDGSLHHMLSVGEVECDSSGRAVRLFGTGQDISERLEAEQALQRSEEQFRRVVEYSPYPLVVVNATGDTESINLKFTELFGWEYQDVRTAERWWSAVYPDGDERREVFVAWQQAIACAEEHGGEIAPQQWPLTCKDGRRREVEFRMVPLGEQRRVLALHDITDQRAAERALRESEQLFRAFFLHAPYGAALSNSRAEILQSNLAMQRMFGLDEEELLARHFRELTVEEDLAASLQLFNELIDGTRDGYQMEKRYRRKDGSTFWGHLAVSAVRDEQGRVKTIFSMVQDITKRIEAQREQNVLQRQLQQAQKMEAIGQLTGGIAHDFNNILASVIGYSELALEHLLPPGHNKLENALMEIQRGGKRAAHLVAQMLDFSRGQALSAEPTNTAVVINEVLEMAAATIPSSITIKTRLCANLPQVMANPVQLHQVLLNIIINARDAMEGKGGLEIATGIGRREGICNSCHEVVSGEFVEIAIRDSAGGLSAEVLARAFEPFFTTKDIGRGSGMGLSMVHGILHDWGGHITVSLSPGVATTFRLHIPLAGPVDEMSATDTAPARGGLVRQARDGAGRVPCILLVDDDEAIGVLIEEMLEPHGYEVEYYNDSRKAMEAFSSAANRYDLLLTDQTMPHLTGLELIAALHAIRPQLPVILCSGYSEQVSAETASSLGIDHYLPKPLQSAELFSAVERLLS